jgi:hypothetical protein
MEPSHLGLGCMGIGFSHWLGPGARLVRGGLYKHNRRTAPRGGRRLLHLATEIGAFQPVLQSRAQGEASRGGGGEALA